MRVGVEAKSRLDGREVPAEKRLDVLQVSGERLGERLQVFLRKVEPGEGGQVLDVLRCHARSHTEPSLGSLR
jgi:hypothetical protein